MYQYYAVQFVDLGEDGRDLCYLSNDGKPRLWTLAGFAVFATAAEADAKIKSLGVDPSTVMVVRMESPLDPWRVEPEIKSPFMGL